jgi:hypothetical protein
LTVFSGIVRLDSKPLIHKATITALLIGYREIPLADRIQEHIPNFAELPDEIRETLIRHDQDRQRSNIEYRLAASEEVSVVEGVPYEYEGPSVRMEGRVAHRSAFYDDLDVPQDQAKGEGEFHFIRFRLTREDGTELGGPDIMKVGTGDIPGLALSFVTKEPATPKIDTAVPVGPDGEEINLERGLINHG